MRATVPTEARVILSLVRDAGSRAHVTFEEGKFSQGRSPGRQFAEALA
jgi:hypothetical protein